MTRKFQVFIFFLAIFFGTLINEINLHYIRSINPTNKEINAKSTVYNYTVYSIDNSFYLPQIKNVIQGKGYTLDPKHPELKVRRSPVYPLFYGIHYLIFGEKLSFLFFRYSQLILFALSCVALGTSVFNFTKDERWAKITSVLYAVSPFAAGYLYFTITEALTPSLIIFCLYFFSLFKRSASKMHLILTGISLGILFLHRPLCGVLLPSFIISLSPWEKGLLQVKRWVMKPIILSLAFILTILPWVIRNYMVTGGELVLAEKFYYEDPMDLGRGHIAYRSWISCWTNPPNYSAEQLSMNLVHNIKNNRQVNDSLINSYINSLPEVAFKATPKPLLKEALAKLNECFINKEELRKKMPYVSLKELADVECEDHVKAEFDQLIKEYRSKEPLQFYFITPLNTAKELILQSNSSNIAFLNPSKGKYTLIQYLIKITLLVLNVVLFISLLAFILFTKGNNDLRLISAFSFFSLFLVLCLFFRYAESRYLLPVFPFMYIALSYYLKKVYNNIRQCLPNNIHSQVN